MSISSAELSAVINEISESGKRRIDKIYHTSDLELLFVFREDKHKRLLINASVNHGAIFLTEKKDPTPKNPSPFTGLLRKNLTGQFLERIEKEKNDRSITLRFSPGGESLYCRFFSNGGFLLTDENRSVIFSHKFVNKPSLKQGDIYDPQKPNSSADDEKEATFTGSPSDAIENKYRQGLIDEYRQAITSTIKKLIKKNERRIQKLKGDLDNLKRFSDYKKYGDLAKTYFHLIPKSGKEAIALTDPETDLEINVPLSPKHSPAENIEILYKKYRKFKSGVKILNETIAQSEKAGAILRDDAEIASNAESTDDMKELIKRYTLSKTKNDDGREMRPTASAKPLRKQERTAHTFRHFTTKDGHEILVGRNDTQNDALVRQSNGNDLWFHIRGFPGSHVVLKTGGKKDVPFEAILEAAKTALNFSSRVRDGKGTITYTQIKNLKKPKNSAPGKVLVTREKTVDVRLD